VTGRRGRRRRKLLDDLKERKGYFHLKEESLDRSMWRARFGKGFGPVVRQTTKLTNYRIFYAYSRNGKCEVGNNNNNNNNNNNSHLLGMVRLRYWTCSLRN
jgi:hypothetical protein